MIIIDDREPTDIIANLRRMGVDYTTDHLEFGDAAWEGNGPTGPVLVGVERKYISDLVDSMISRRLAGHQLGGLANAYDVRYLLVEGVYRPNVNTDSIDVLNYKGEWVPMYHQRSSVSYQQVDSFLDEISESGVTVLKSGGIHETAAIYRSRYRHWQKAYSDRRSMRLIYVPELDQPKNGNKARLTYLKPTFINRVCSLLPGVDMKAWDLEAAFHGKPRDMANANADTWRHALGIKSKKSKTVADIVATWEGKL